MKEIKIMAVVVIRKGDMGPINNALGRLQEDYRLYQIISFHRNRKVVDLVVLVEKL